MPDKKDERVLVFLIAYVVDMQDVNMEEGLEKLNERGHAQVVDVKTAMAKESGWQQVATQTAERLRASLEAHDW